MSLGVYPRDLERDPNHDAITPQGSVVYNAFLNHDENERRMNQKQAPLYPRGSDEFDYCILRTEPCWQFNSTFSLHNQGQKKREIYLNSSLNGAFQKNDNLAALYDLIQFVGFAVTDCKWDPRKTNLTKIGLPVHTHGSTQILNSGPKMIKKGDWVLMRIPNPTHPIAAPIQNNEKRIILQTVPYNPRDPTNNEFALLASNLDHYISSRKKVGKHGHDSHEKNIVADGALMLRQSIMQAVLVSIDSLCSSGILTVNEAFLANERYIPEPAANGARIDYENVKLEFLRKLHDVLQITSNASSFGVWKEGERMGIDEVLDKALFSNDREFAIFKDHIVRDENYNLKKDIMEDQLTFCERMIKAKEWVASHFSPWIAGVSMSDARPGERLYLMQQRIRAGV